MSEFIEALEQRVSLSLTVQVLLHDGILTVNATPPQNLIGFGTRVVGLSGGMIIVGFGSARWNSPFA